MAVPSTKSEALAWLKQQPDAIGECDGCHKEMKSLYSLPQNLDSEPDAHWLYCRDCFRKIVSK